VLMTAGSLIPRKNHALLIDALATLRTGRRDVVLMILGDGPLRGTLERHAAARVVGDAVVFTGYVPEAEKVDTLGLADVFVFGSVLEGFGLAPIEAMTCGKPVVALRCPSLLESVDDGVSGFLVDVGNVEMFADRVARLLADGELRRRFGAATARRVDQLFRLEHVVQRTMRICEDAIFQYRDRARVRAGGVGETGDQALGCPDSY